MGHMSEMGLRERKNAQTKRAIERAALELALEQGYEHTTVDQIAARADVSLRTVYVRYRTKEAIYAGDGEEQPFGGALEGGEGDVFDRLSRYLQSMIAEGLSDPDSQLWLRATMTDPYLRGMLRSNLEQAERALVERLLADYALAPGDIRARTLGAAFSGLLLAFIEDALDPADDFDPAAEIEAGIGVLRAGLTTLG